MYEAQALFTWSCLDTGTEQVTAAATGVSSVSAGLDDIGAGSSYQLRVALDGYDEANYRFTGWTVNGAAAAAAAPEGVEVTCLADGSLLLEASGADLTDLAVEAVFEIRTGYAITVTYTNCTLEDSKFKLSASNTIPTDTIVSGSSYLYRISNYRDSNAALPLEKIVINGTETVVPIYTTSTKVITITGIDGITAGTVRLQVVPTTNFLQVSFASLTVTKDIAIELVFDLPDPDHTPAVSVAAEDQEQGEFVESCFKENTEDGSVWIISAVLASGCRLSGYSVDTVGAAVYTPEVTWRVVNEKEFTGYTTYTDDDGNEVQVPHYHNHLYYYCDFELTLTEDAAVTLYFDLLEFSLEYYDKYVDVPWADRYGLEIPFNETSCKYIRDNYLPDTELYEACNAVFYLKIPFDGYINNGVDIPCDYTVRAYAGDTTEAENLLVERSGTVSINLLYGYTGGVYFKIDSMPSISRMTVEVTFLGQTRTCTFDVDMPQPSAETAALQAYYTGAFGLDKFGKEAYTAEEKASESYALYCANSRFRYYLRETYKDQLSIVGRADDADRPAALEAAKIALDDAARGKGADAVVCGFDNRTGVSIKPIFTGVPTGSDNVAKTGVNAETCMKAALEAQYPANWTFLATQSQFGAFVTGIRAGGEDDIGGSVDTTGYNSYGFWYYNGKFSEWGVTNYYVSDGDILTWASGAGTQDFIWDWAVLRWQLNDRAMADAGLLAADDPLADDEYLAEALAAKGVTYLGQDFYALTPAQLEAWFPEVDFSRYGQLRELRAEEEVVRLINAIGDVSSDSGDAIRAARSAYDALEPEVQAAVSNYDTLVAAETAYAALGQQSGHTYQEALSAALTTLQNGQQLGVGSLHGEWAVLALARNGSIAGGDASGQAPGYLADLGSELDSQGLDGIASVYTTYARITLALSALGLDASSFTTANGSYDLISKLEEYDQVAEQGLNGPVFALLALDSKPYLTEDAGLRDKYVQYILDAELAGGGWNYSGDAADPDMTAMALQALAPYRANNTGAAAAAERGLAALKGLQKSSGGFSSYGMYNAESTAQVIVALTALGVSPAGADWTTAENLDPVEALLHFYNEVFGMFQHSLVGNADQMATEQSAYALVAYNRFNTGKNALYTMSDAFTDPGVDPDADVQADVAAAQAAVESLGAQSISMNTANTEEGVLNYIKNLLNTLDLHNTMTSAAVSAFAPAAAGTSGSPDGTAGSFACAVTLSKTNGTDYASAAVQVSGTITALPYSGSTSDVTITVYFTLLGTAADGENGTVNTLSKNNLTTWISQTAVTLDEGARVCDAFTEVLDENGYSYAGAEDNYVSSITTPAGLTLAEFTNGKNSGWMYTVNGTHPNVGLCAYVLSDGDNIVWHYTDDYTIEEGSEKWNSGGASTTTSDSATLTPKATASNGTGAASVSASDITAAIKDVKEKGSAAIVIAPEITGEANKVTVELPKSSLTTVASETDAGLTVETPVGSLTIPNSALASIAAQASGGTVTVSLEAVDNSSLTPAQQTVVGDKPVYDITIASGGSSISGFGGSSLTISLPYTLKDGEDPSGVTVWYLNDAGQLQQVACAFDPDTGKVTFTTDHLSYYVVGYAEYAAAPVWTNPFTDVKPDDWFYDSVAFAVQNGLFSGAGDTTFSPGEPMTRAMLVTVLYRLEGQPSITGANSFTDVESGQWYTGAVIWANAEGIVTGYGGGLFGASDSVTRQQLAAILYNYAKHKGYDVTAAADLAAYTDAAEISGWAQAAVQWAKAEGLITGRTASTLVPEGSATRAEVAAILMRFVGRFAE